VQPAFFIALWLLSNVAAVGVYDVYASFFLGPDQSVSYWVQSWLRQLPILGFGLGVVVGHLAWPIHPSIVEKVVKDGNGVGPFTK